MTYIDTEAKRRRLQQALLDHGFDIGPDGVDGFLGGDTAKAIINARIAHKLDHQDRAEVDTDLMRELGLLTIQDPVVVGIAKTKGIDIFALIGLIGSVQAFLKGMKMDSTTVDVKSAWLSSKNWAAGIAILTNIAAFFHVAIPPDLAPQVQALVTSAAAIYIIVKNTWFTGTITTASAKKLP